jgi:NAD(P)H-flavin reductase/hemoglobin-like flavoprotein
MYTATAPDSTAAAMVRQAAISGQYNGAGSVLTAADSIREIRESFAVIEPHGAEATAWLYEHFFTFNPRYHKLFAGVAVAGEFTSQQRRLFQAVRGIVADLDHLDLFLSQLRRLALRHRKYGLRAAHYEAFGRSLLATVECFAAPVWTERTRAAWEAGYGLVASVMLEATAEANATTAPYWEAEVVEHEMLTGQIARLAARVFEDPHLPGAYSLEVGQYAALETPALIRVWRDFSFAAPPRPDGLVEFHIQAGRSGGVSEALVRRTAVGDRLRIAAAQGELAFPSAARAGRPPVDHLVSVTHGTGAAPVAALIEAAIATGDRRPVDVLLVVDADDGSDEHYLAGHFAQLAARHGALRVEQVTGDPLPVLRARMTAAAAGPAERCGAVLVGPGAMIDACRELLVSAGVDHRDVASDLFS